MTAMLRSRWQKIKQRWVAIVVTTAIMVAIAVLIVCLWFNGTGFNGYTQVSTIHTLSGPTAGTVTRTETNQPGKTLWDLMQLLIIPVVLAVAGFWFNHRERKAAELRAEADREISFDNQREAALKEYVDKMSELLLHENLRKSEPEGEVRKIARVLTLTVLPRLDGGRKRSILQFLQESGLIGKNTPVISLEEADLRGVNLVEAMLLNADLTRAKLSAANLEKVHLTTARLIKADLSGANLEKADLFFADMEGVNLSGASLEGADLRSADLRKANLEGADLRGANLINAKLIGTNISVKQLGQAAPSLTATMSDGSKHP